MNVVSIRTPHCVIILRQVCSLFFIAAGNVSIATAILTLIAKIRSGSTLTQNPRRSGKIVGSQEGQTRPL